LVEPLILGYGEHTLKETRPAIKIAYLMDPLEIIQPENETTSHLMYACNERGHAVYFLEPYDVYIRNGQVVARMRNITVKPGLTMAEYWLAIIRCTKQDHLIFEAITQLDALFLRSKASGGKA
jgi:glutathione synthase